MCSVFTVLCPLCGSEAREERQVPPHFCDELWTDGKMIPALRHERPLMVSCPECRQCFWYSSAEPPSFKPRRAVKHLPRVRVPQAAEYLAWLDRHPPGFRLQETLVRMHAWWRHNDAHRNRHFEMSSPEPGPDSAWRQNLEALWELLSRNPADSILEYPEILLKAEIYRELGDFQEARNLLSVFEVDSFSELAAVRETILELCEEGNGLVACVDRGRIVKRGAESVRAFAEEWLEPHPGRHVFTYEVEGAYHAWVAQHEEKYPLRDSLLLEVLGIIGYPGDGSIRIPETRLRKPIPPGFEVYTQEWRDSFERWSAERSVSGKA
jgi:hypothetical protein